MLDKIIPTTRVAKLGSLNCLSNMQDTAKFSPRKFSKNRNRNNQRKFQKQNEKFLSNQVSLITKAIFRLCTTVSDGNWTRWTVLQRHLIPITLKCQWIFHPVHFWMNIEWILNFLSVERHKTDEKTNIYDEIKKKEWCRMF